LVGVKQAIDNIASDAEVKVEVELKLEALLQAAISQLCCGAILAAGL
jgi:hypothetical protein